MTKPTASNIEQVREIIEHIRWNIAPDAHTFCLCERCGGGMARNIGSGALCVECLQEDLEKIVAAGCAEQFVHHQKRCSQFESDCLEQAERLDQEAEAKDANQD